MQKFYKKHFCLFVLPLLVCFTVAFLVPFFMAILFSFTNYKTIEIWHFVGFQNYVQAFGPGTTFWYSLGITVLFAIVSSVIVNVFAFALAVLLSKGLKGSNFFRSVFFMPNLVGGIVLGYIWSLMIGSVLNLFHKNIASGFSYGFWGLIIMTCWQQVGYMMVIYIAALANVSRDLTEAAEVDGASHWQTLFRIIIPVVSSSIAICTFLSLSSGFKMFDQNLALNGIANEETRLLSLDIYNTMFNNPTGNEGVGQAKAVVFFLIIAGASYLNFHIRSRREAT